MSALKGWQSKDKGGEYGGSERETGDKEKKEIQRQR